MLLKSFFFLQHMSVSISQKWPEDTSLIFSWWINRLSMGFFFPLHKNLPLLYHSYIYECIWMYMNVCMYVCTYVVATWMAELHGYPVFLIIFSSCFKHFINFPHLLWDLPALWLKTSYLDSLTALQSMVSLILWGEKISLSCHFQDCFSTWAKSNLYRSKWHVCRAN